MRPAAILVALALAGCISTPPATLVAPAPDLSPFIAKAVVPAAASVPLNVCPPKVDYTQAQLDAFANAMAALDAAKPSGYQVIEGFLTDYHNMRAADDICFNSKK